MREIKFRGWDNREARWLGGSTAEIVAHGGSDRFTLMQYTGLKDKNGKEIYEGDIYKYDVGDGEPEIGVFESIHDFYFSELRRYRVEQGEIIGNIYENPNLLEDGN